MDKFTLIKSEHCLLGWFCISKTDSYSILNNEFNLCLHTEFHSL